MSTPNKSQPADPQEQAAKDGVATELSSEAIKNLTGFFDVLIQMDFAKQIKEGHHDVKRGVHAGNITETNGALQRKTHKGNPSKDSRRE